MTSSLLPCGCEDEHAAAFSLHNLQRMFTTKCLEGKTAAAVSKLAATQPTFNFMLLITAWTPSPPSHQSRPVTRRESTPLQSVIEEDAAMM